MTSVEDWAQAKYLVDSATPWILGCAFVTLYGAVAAAKKKDGVNYGPRSLYRDFKTMMKAYFGD